MKRHSLSRFVKNKRPTLSTLHSISFRYRAHLSRTPLIKKFIALNFHVECPKRYLSYNSFDFLDTKFHKILQLQSTDYIIVAAMIYQILNLFHDYRQLSIPKIAIFRITESRLNLRCLANCLIVAFLSAFQTKLHQK